MANSRQQIISRDQAREKGWTRYRTGEACRFGHYDERYVSNKQCVACNAQKARSRESTRSRTDPSYRMYRSVQRRSGQALMGHASPTKALGCDRATLREFIARSFGPGMTWDRYGQWEVDHIVPLSAARTPTQLLALCHFTNLQALWKRDNQLKGGA